MRIALLTECFYPTFDGATTAVKNLADELIAAGHEVVLIAPGPGLSSYRGCPVARIALRDRPGRHLHAVLRDIDPDLVHVTSPGALGRKALKQARRLDLATLVVESSVPDAGQVDTWRRRVRDRSDRLLVPAAWQQAALAELGATAQLWRPGVSITTFHPRLRDAQLHRSWAGKESQRVVVGYVGSLHKRHGVRQLTQLADLPGIRLVVIGVGPQERWLRGLLPRAKFVGAYETGALATAMASLDIVVHPGLSETSCHPHREAAASGVPVVAPRSGGAPEVVLSLETGLLYDPDQPHALRRAVEAVAGDRHRGLLGQRAHELQSRDWRTAVAELLRDHYQPMLTGAAPQGEPLVAASIDR